MASCEEVQEGVEKQRWAALSPAEREDTATHLAGCAACRALVDESRRLTDAFRGLGIPPVPPALLDRLQEQALPFLLRARSRRWQRSWLRVLARPVDIVRSLAAPGPRLAVTAALALSIGFLAGFQAGRERSGPVKPMVPPSGSAPQAPPPRPAHPLHPAPTKLPRALPAVVPAGATRGPTAGATSRAQPSPSLQSDSAPLELRWVGQTGGLVPDTRSTRKLVLSADGNVIAEVLGRGRVVKVHRRGPAGWSLLTDRIFSWTGVHALSPTGTCFATAMPGKDVMVFWTGTGRVRCTMSSGAEVHSLAWVGDDTILYKETGPGAFWVRRELPPALPAPPGAALPPRSSGIRYGHNGARLRLSPDDSATPGALPVMPQMTPIPPPMAPQPSGPPLPPFPADRDDELQGPGPPLPPLPADRNDVLQGPGPPR